MAGALGVSSIAFRPDAIYDGVSTGDDMLSLAPNIPNSRNGPEAG